MINNIPVYQFIGYRLLKANFNRIQEGNIDYITIRNIQSELKNENTFILIVEILIKYENNESSTFVFDSCFKINDIKWFNELDGNLVNNLFISVIFPYIRQKIYEVTNDSRGGLQIPIVDLRNIDLTKGLKLIAQHN